MKKLIYVALISSLSFGVALGCKKEDSMLAIASKSGEARKSFALNLIYSGECKALYREDYSIIKHTMNYTQVLANDGNYYWLIRGTAK